MTFFHFVNCVALAYAPYVITFKYSGLSEYSSIWKCGQAAAGFLLIQLGKLMFLATCFPSSDPADGFAVVPELLKSSADIIDIVGLYLIISFFMTGKSEVRFVTAGLGWAFAHSIASRMIPFWVGARATAFHWRYVQSALDSSSDLVFWMAAACLAWLATRETAGRHISFFLIFLAVFHSFIFQFLHTYLGVSSWMMVAARALYSVGLGFGTMVAYAKSGTQSYKRE